MITAGCLLQLARRCHRRLVEGLAEAPYCQFSNIHDGSIPLLALASSMAPAGCAAVLRFSLPAGCALPSLPADKVGAGA